MLLIRDNQLALFRRAARERFIDRAVDGIGRHWPAVARSMPTLELRALVTRAADAAEHFGFGTETQMLRFINLTVALGEGFEQRPDCYWAPAILKHPTVSPDSKLDLLLARAQSVLRERP